MKKINKRIDKIQQDHLALLKMVKESLSQNNNNFNDGVKDVVEVLNASDLDVKTYKAIVQAQELITDLTQQIVNATDHEDIINLRKKLNYYINKIKSILKKRNIEESVIDTYLEKTTTFRKDIARYIRILKRESNIAAINNSYANLDNLSEEELKELKKLIEREISYHTRNLNPTARKPRIKKDPVIPEVTNPVSLIKYQAGDAPEMLFPEVIDQDTEEAKNCALIVVHTDVSEPLVSRHPRTISEINFDEVSEQFAKTAASFSKQYCLAPTYDYTLNSHGQNIINFFRNIPRYMHNKKILKSIENDTEIYYRGSDIISFREYVRQRNSISQGLRCIFSRSYLFTEEATTLNHHQKCSEWLFNYCKENNLELPLQFFSPRKTRKAF